MTTYADLVHADGALVHLPLTEATGPTSHDVIGAHDGTWYNDPTPGVSGPITGETALTFAHGPDGPFVLLAEPGTLPTFPGPFSWEVWFMLPSYITAFFGPTFSTGTTIDGVVVRDALLNASSPDTPFVNLHVDAPPFSSFSDGSGPDETLAYDGGWHHLVYTCDGAGATAIYLDGVAISNDGAPTGWSVEEPTAAVIGGQAQLYEPTSYAYVGAFAGSLAHVALYPAALLPCQVLAHYDLATTGTYTPCPEWVRLAHRSGQGYWQSKGDVTEEWAGGARRLVLPLPTLTATPAVLVGKDPVTSVPAYCPAPTPYSPSATPIPAAIVPTGPDPLGDGTDACVGTRCGAALAMAQHLRNLYSNWRFWMNAALSAMGGAAVSLILDWLEALIASLVLAEQVASWFLTVFKTIKPNLNGLSVGALANVFPDWDDATVNNVQQVFFCALQCESGVVSVSAGDLNNTAAFIFAHTSDFLGSIVSDVLAFSCEYSSLADWQAVISGAGPSNLCNGYSCA